MPKGAHHPFFLTRCLNACLFYAVWILERTYVLIVSVFTFIQSAFVLGEVWRKSNTTSEGPECDFRAFMDVRISTSKVTVFHAFASAIRMQSLSPFLTMSHRPIADSQSQTLSLANV